MLLCIAANVIPMLIFLSNPAHHTVSASHADIFNKIDVGLLCDKTPDGYELMWNE